MSASCIMNKRKESDCELLPPVTKVGRVLKPLRMHSGFCDLFSSQKLSMMSNFSWIKRYWGREEGREESSADSDLATVLSTPVASTDNSKF